METKRKISDAKCIWTKAVKVSLQGSDWSFRIANFPRLPPSNFPEFVVKLADWKPSGLVITSIIIVGLCFLCGIENHAKIVLFEFYGMQRLNKSEQKSEEKSYGTDEVLIILVLVLRRLRGC